MEAPLNPDFEKVAAQIADPYVLETYLTLIQWAAEGESVRVFVDGAFVVKSAKTVVGWYTDRYGEGQ